MMVWSEMARPEQYTLGQLIDRLKAAPLGRTLKVGFLNPPLSRLESGKIPGSGGADLGV